ncbi:family 16 glycoside hydrolase, partial [Bradyrhizobium ottawaense]
KKITDRTCYEANIFDQRPDPSYGTGAITRYIEINPKPKAGGKWNTFEITAKGRDITVVLNGQKTAELRNGMFDEGDRPATRRGNDQIPQSRDQAFVRRVCATARDCCTANFE